MPSKSLTKLLGFFHSKVQYHSEIMYHVVSEGRETNLTNTRLSGIISGQSGKLFEGDTFPLMML